MGKSYVECTESAWTVMGSISLSWSIAESVTGCEHKNMERVAAIL